MPRFVALVKADKEMEAGRMPTEQELADMGAFNEELVKNGVMLAGEGLHPSSKGVRIDFEGGKPSVTDGPFTEVKELVAGFWILQAASLDEAVEWISRAPFQDGRIEIRQVFEDDDFGEEFTPELREQEARIRSEIANR